MTKPVLYICLGPTASGKEAAALLAAEQVGGEILSVDSMKIYRTLDVGTAKPSAHARARVRHHGLDIADPGEPFSVGDYVRMAEAAIADILARGRQPVLSGGTALYYKALLDGLFDAPGADPDLRGTLQEEARRLGTDALHRRLAAVDPQAAEKIHPHDLRRIIRALEVHIHTGEPISRHQREWNGFHGDTGATPPEPFSRYRHVMVWLDWPRPILHGRIRRRVERMLQSGLEDEARRVWDMRERMALAPLQAVGYKEFFGWFEGREARGEAVELLLRNTRRLAKSQCTWFRKFPAIRLPMEESRSDAGVASQMLAIWQRGADDIGGQHERMT